MKILSHRELQEREMKYDLTQEILSGERLFERLKEKYGDGFDSDNLFLDLCYVVSLFGNDFRKKKVLDLGCGSTGGSYDFDMMQKEEWGRRHFEPWFPRVLHMLGVKVIGVDYGRLNGEEFENYRLNLLTPDSLKFISNGFIDLANARLLYTSPQLDNMTPKNNKELIDEVKDKSMNYWSIGDSERYARKSLERVLLPQLERIVKPEGYFVYG